MKVFSKMQIEFVILYKELHDSDEGNFYNAAFLQEEIISYGLIGILTRSSIVLSC